MDQKEIAALRNFRIKLGKEPKGSEDFLFPGDNQLETTFVISVTDKVTSAKIVLKRIYLDVIRMSPM